MMNKCLISAIQLSQESIFPDVGFEGEVNGDEGWEYKPGDRVGMSGRVEM